MGITRSDWAAAVTLVVCTAALSLSLPANAGQSSAGQTVKQEVPDNVAEHTPPVQPIPYNHKIHLALGLTCQGCHKNPDPGKLMTYPATSDCVVCHAKRKPAIPKLVSFAKSPQPIPWVRVYAVLPGVNWTHRKHVDAGIKCEACHGQVAEIEVMSEVTSVTTMAVCLNCHMAHNAATVCQTCHPWPPESSD